MIPRIISDTSITFIARGRPWSLAVDHPAFKQVADLLNEGSDDEEKLINLTDVRFAVDAATEGKAILTEEGLFLDGVQLSQEWADKAASEPDAMRVLVVSVGDRVRVAGDNDAPDGIYTVGDVDDKDVNNRVYVESEEDYFGFVSNTSIKEILKDEVDASQ